MDIVDEQNFKVFTFKEILRSNYFLLETLTKTPEAPVPDEETESNDPGEVECLLRSL